MAPVIKSVKKLQKKWPKNLHGSKKGYNFALAIGKQTHDAQSAERRQVTPGNFLKLVR